METGILQATMAIGMMGLVVGSTLQSIRGLDIAQEKMLAADFDTDMHNFYIRNISCKNSTASSCDGSEALITDNGSNLLAGGEESFSFGKKESQITLSHTCTTNGGEKSIQVFHQKKGEAKKPTFGSLAVQCGGCSQEPITFEKRGNGSDWGMTKANSKLILDPDEYASRGIRILGEKTIAKGQLIRLPNGTMGPAPDDVYAPIFVTRGSNMALGNNPKALSPNPGSGAYNCRDLDPDIKNVLRGANGAADGNYFIFGGKSNDPDSDELYIEIQYTGSGSSIASGNIRDFDANEKWVMTSFDSSDAVIEKKVFQLVNHDWPTHPETPLPALWTKYDCRSYPWVIGSEGGPTIKKIKFQGYKPGTRGFGIGFDTFSPNRCS